MDSPKSVPSTFLKIFLAGSLFLGLSLSAHAQGITTASITGKIADASGASIPETMITVTNEETGTTRNTVSDAQGDYQALQLQVGRYDIKAEKMGFKAAQQTGIDLVVGQQAVVNLTLSVGDVQQVVTVSEEAPLVNTTTATIAGVVGEKSVKELPLNGRSFDTLIALNAGATNISLASGAAPGVGGAAAQQGQEFSVAGRRWSQNLFLLNGVEYAGPSQFGSEPGGVSGQLLGVDAVREFNVVSDSYGASYGHRSGGQISIATQSGSNQLHGNVFEFIRNSALDSRSIFNLPTSANPGSGKADGGHFERNQFGGSLGGPIQKDKTFVFGNYEGFRQLLNITGISTVPDNCARGTGGPAACSGVPVGTISSTDSCGVYHSDNLTISKVVTPVDQAMMPWIDGFWPAPNFNEITQTAPAGCGAATGTQVPTGIAQGLYTPLNTVREDFGTTRFDHTFSDKDTFSGIYTIDDGLNEIPTVGILTEDDISIRAQILSFQETHLFSPTVINSFITGYSRSGFGYYSPAIGCPAIPTPAGCPLWPNSLLMTPGRNPGTIILTTGGIVNGGGSAATGLTSRRNLFTMTDNVQIVRGRHTIGIGGWAAYLASNELAPNSQSGQATFNAIQNLVTGTSSNLFVPVQTTLYWRQWEGAWFVEDNIQLRSNLTFRIGLRHEFTNGYNEDKGNAYNYLYDPSNPGLLLTNPVQSGSPLTQNNAVALFAPRAAIAWDPTGKGKMSIRAAGGIYYDTLDTLGQQFLDRVAPTNPLEQGAGLFTSTYPIVTGVVQPQCAPGVTTSAPITPANPTGGCANYTPNGIQSFSKVPTIYEWNLTYQQAITANTTFSIGYVGSHGVHEATGADPNEYFSAICSTPAGCQAGGNATTLTTGGKLAPSTAAMGQLYVPIPAPGPAGACNGTGISICLRNPYLPQGTELYTYGFSRYNAMNVEVTHRFSYGLQFKGAYTYSRDLDVAGQSTGGTQLTDTYDPRLDYGPSIQNQTHKFSFSGGYELPWGKGKHFGNGVTGIADKLISGWQLNWVATVQSGLPFTPSGSNNDSGDGESGRTGNQGVDYNNSFTGQLYNSGSNLFTANSITWFNANAFVQPTTAGVFPQVNRDFLVKPGLAQLNFSVFKNTKVNERLSIQFRAEAFNMLNNVNLGSPSTTAFSSSGAPSSSAGAITSINSTARQVQFGLKGIF